MFDPETKQDETPNITYSNYQLAIFDFVANDKRSLVVEAKAGSGKTFTMIECTKRLPYPEDNILALAFNKAIATTLQARVPKFVTARTFNSLGYGALKQQFNAEMDTKKVNAIMRKVVPNSLHDEFLYELCRIIQHGKAWGIGYFAVNENWVWADLLNDNTDFDIDDIYPKCISWLVKGYDISVQDTTTMDFNDQILFPLLYSIPGKRYDIIFVDEAQDLSPIQHAFITHFLTKSGRMIAFGDSNQAIYGFRGADSDSLQKLRDRFQAETLPLSISYRCPKAVILEAQTIVPEILPASEALEGTVGWINMPEISTFNAKDLILCRNNAPLVKLGLQFLREKQLVHVRGDFGRTVIKFIKKFKTDDIILFLDRLESWYHIEYNQAMRDGKKGKAYTFEERYLAVKVIATDKEITNVKQLIAVIEKLFDSVRGTTLSSIHRAKGEEANRIFILRPELMPSHYAKGKMQQQQEENIRYVAITRSKNELYFIIHEGH